MAEKWIQSYDLSNGDLTWKIRGNQYGNISTPVAADGIVYVGSGLREGRICAICLSGAKGDITGSSAVIWSFEKKLYPYVPSALIFNGCLYFTKGQVGFLTCLDTASGQVHYSNTRLSGISHIFASPTGVRDRVYFLGRKGIAVVIRSGPEFKVLAKNSLDDKFDASPVIVGNQIYLRGYKYLYCISK